MIICSVLAGRKLTDYLPSDPLTALLSFFGRIERYEPNAMMDFPQKDQIRPELQDIPLNYLFGFLIPVPHKLAAQHKHHV